VTELERLELALRSVIVNDIWTPTELLNAIIEEITRRNIEVVDASANTAELESLR
jgi:hypothetical protein